MMLSESQERMLMVLKPGKEAEAEAIFRKWGLDFAIIGRTTDTLRFVVRHGGEVKADLPIKELGDEAPLYDRPHVADTAASRSSTPASVAAADRRSPRRCCSSSARPTCARKRWVWEQYDHLILGNTVQRPGGDAAVVRVGDGPKGLALTTDVTPRYCEADPVEGGKQAVAEAWRNLTAVGARPLAVTDNLNFGNPERPEIMGQFVGCIEGIGEACRALDFPVVSGNVSLYNETNGRGILPTPTIGGVGLVDDVTQCCDRRPSSARATRSCSIGETQGWLGQSVYLREICGREEGAPPPVDLAAETPQRRFRARPDPRRGRSTPCHDLSDGGLARRARRDGDGRRRRRDASTGCPAALPAHAFCSARTRRAIVLTVDRRGRQRCSRAPAPPACRSRGIGTTGGDALTLPGDGAISVAELVGAHEGWLPGLHGRRADAAELIGG